MRLAMIKPVPVAPAAGTVLLTAIRAGLVRMGRLVLDVQAWCAFTQHCLASARRAELASAHEPSGARRPCPFAWSSRRRGRLLMSGMPGRALINGSHVALVRSQSQISSQSR